MHRVRKFKYENENYMILEDRNSSIYTSRG